LARPDVPVFPLAAVGHLDLRLPCRGVADSHPDAVSLSDADHDAVRRACSDMVDAILEGLLGRLDRLVWAVEKLAGREPRLADAVPAHPDSALAVFPGLPAWVALVERWARRRAAVELYIPDEAPSAA
jgi:phage tail protein X